MRAIFISCSPQSAEPPWVSKSTRCVGDILVIECSGVSSLYQIRGLCASFRQNGRTAEGVMSQCQDFKMRSDGEFRMVLRECGKKEGSLGFLYRFQFEIGTFDEEKRTLY